MKLIIEKLVSNQNRKTTVKAYLGIWRQFNDFLLKLDSKPECWEDRVTLYIAHLVEDRQLQLSTIKSYVSAIKCMLVNDKYDWDDNLILLNSLTKACRSINDRVMTRLPISCSFLELILFEVWRKFGKSQFYLATMFMTLFPLAYYRLMRVGELTASDHVMKACNIHLALNKQKILIVLRSSNTHTKGMHPQKIKIVSNQDEKSGSYRTRNFCPFHLLSSYIRL